MTRRPTLPIVALVLAALAAGACGSDGAGEEGEGEGVGEGEASEGEGEGDGEGEGEGDGAPSECDLCEAPAETCVQGRCVLDAAADYAFLTDGVVSITPDGAYHSVLSVVGPRAHPLLLSADAKVMVAFGRAGRGRYVVTGHESDFIGSNAGLPDVGRFVDNWIRFVGRGATPTVAVHPGSIDALDNLSARGFEATAVEAQQLDANTHQVYVVTAFNTLSDVEQNALISFLDNGGGLLVGGTAWWFGSAEVIAETYPGNRLPTHLGVVFSSDAVWPDTHSVLPFAQTHAFHASTALDRLQEEAQTPGSLGADAAQVGKTVVNAVAAVAAGHPYFARAQAAIAGINTDVRAGNPVSVTTEPLRAVAIAIESAVSLKLPAEQVQAAPSHAAFPGTVDPATTRVTRTMSIDANASAAEGNYAFSGAGAALWRSTGLYAAAGDVVEVTMAQALEDSGLSVQIGAHTDTLFHLETWERSPSIVSTRALNVGTTTIASAYGGPVYIVVPRGSALGTVEVTIAGAVPMGRFVLGQTTNQQWIDVERATPAPMVELESRTFIITVPRTAMVQALADPTDLMQQWDEVLDVDQRLAAMPVRTRQERFVLDEQISAGWMHSGYPIMGFTEAEAALIDANTIDTGLSWGPLHELGHNHQWYPAVPSMFTEVTCNLYSVRASEDALGIDRSTAWEGPGLSDANRTARVQAFKNAGRPWSSVADEPVVGLELFLQLEERFGWSFYETVHAAYAALPEQPEGDAAVIDTWVRLSSQAAGMDLTGYYAAWSLPFSASIVDELSALPDWTDHPML
jgi:hypothetical protein